MDFKELCEKRFSARAYSGEPMPADKISYIQECVRLAPSACNKQPWLFLAVKSEEARKKLRACYDREWFAEAPLYIVACDRKSQAWTRPSDGKHHGDVDVSIAIEHLCLAAANVGVGTCWVCNFDVPRCKEALHLPEDLEPVAIIPMGMPTQEPAPKKRKPVEEIWQEI